MDIHICSEEWDQERGEWGMHVGACKEAHVCTQLWKGSGADMVTYIHVLMNANILNKLWDQIRGDWDTYRQDHKGAHMSRMSRYTPTALVKSTKIT